MRLTRTSFSCESYGLFPGCGIDIVSFKEGYLQFVSSNATGMGGACLLAAWLRPPFPAGTCPKGYT